LVEVQEVEPKKILFNDKRIFL